MCSAQRGTNSQKTSTAWPRGTWARCMQSSLRSVKATCNGGFWQQHGSRTFLSANCRRPKQKLLRFWTDSRSKSGVFRSLRGIIQNHYGPSAISAKKILPVLRVFSLKTWKKRTVREHRKTHGALHKTSVAKPRLVPQFRPTREARGRS